MQTSMIASSPPESFQLQTNPSENFNDKAEASRAIHRDDILLLVGISIMLTWPWVFFGITWALGGIQANRLVAGFIADNPHGTSYFVTLIASIISIIIDALFSMAIIRFSQEWVQQHATTQVFHITLFFALRYKNWPWRLNTKDLNNLLNPDRWLPAFLAGACIGTFAFTTSSTTSLLTPVPFTEVRPLQGAELDFSSNASECLGWFSYLDLSSNNCDWQLSNGMEYTSCLGQNQIIDVLESGRGNILSLLSNNSPSLMLSELGNENGLHFLGSVRGVLPMGPNGAIQVPTFDDLWTSSFSTVKVGSAYNYTLENQGLSSNISCVYDTQSPIVYGRLDPNSTLALQYNSSCNGLAEATPYVASLIATNSINTLLFWACKSPPNAKEVPSYFIYLRGIGLYERVIGNITCTVSPIRPAIFPVTYQSIPRTFSLKDPIAVSANTSTVLVEEALVGLAGVIQDAQNWNGNLVAESVITLGVKSFGLQPYAQTAQYLRIYEAMLQGILDYEASYIRLIYSMIPDLPSSCIRTMNGSLTYEVIGWSVKPEHIGYLMPLTVVNLVSLVVLVVALHMTKRDGSRFDPTDPRHLIYATHNSPEAVPDEWKDTITFDLNKGYI